MWRANIALHMKNQLPVQDRTSVAEEQVAFQHLFPSFAFIPAGWQRKHSASRLFGGVSAWTNKPQSVASRLARVANLVM